MIQLTKDLLLANNNLSKTPKETKKHDSNSSGKDFASFLEIEDEGAGTTPELAEGVNVEEGILSAENSENGKNVLNKGDDFLSINVNLQLLIGEAGNQNIDTGEAEENESDEVVVSDEGEDESEKTGPVKVDLYTLNVNVNNVNLENVNLVNVSLENVNENINNVNLENIRLENAALESVSNVENVSLENIKNNPMPDSDVNLQSAEDGEALPESSVKFDVPAPQVSPEQQSLHTEEESDVDLLPGDEKVDDNVNNADVNKNSSGLNQKINQIMPEISETPLNENVGPEVEAPETENVNAASKMAETGEVAVNQNLTAASKNETKGNKKSEAVSKSDAVPDIPEKKASVLTVDKSADKVQEKNTAQVQAEEPADTADITAKPDMEKSSVIIKSSAEDKIPDNDAEKAENLGSGNKSAGFDEQVKKFDKEMGAAADDLDLDKEMTKTRPEFQDFMDKISEQRSAPSSASPKTQPQPQQMSLINRGPAAFSESVGNVVRFTTNTDGLTKATLIVDPPALGRVNIEITSADNGIETVLKVSNEQVRVLVQDQIIQLKQNLAQIGVNLAEFSVDVQQDDGRQRGQSFGNKSKNARAGIAEEEESEAEKIETFRVDLRKGLLHWVA